MADSRWPFAAGHQSSEIGRFEFLGNSTITSSTEFQVLAPLSQKALLIFDVTCRILKGQLTHRCPVSQTIPYQASAQSGQLKRTLDLLGGPKLLRRRVNTPIEAHELLVAGLPNKALLHLIDSLILLGAAHSLEKAIGMSVRTVQRKKERPDQALDKDQSGRAWRFAELLANASEVFGSQEAAEKWFDQPAIGLDRNRPIDLLDTPAGQELVENYLEQLEYGVYV
ncbi:MAG: antitoxin Xre/MbcA/ParS toxin-binding domain-containing protein [Hyphomonas sp.]